MNKTTIGPLFIVSSLVVGLYLLFPLIVVIVISFSSEAFLSFPPPGFSLRWYEQIFSSWDWIRSFWLTIQVGLITAVLSTLLGVPAAFALSRYQFPGKDFINTIFFAALIAPPIIKAISIYLFYIPLSLNGTVFGLAFAHTVSGIPFVVINVVASLRSFDPALERAAMIHGATPARAVMNVTLPVIMPGILVGTIFAFMQSAQELLIAIFVLGGRDRPLAVKLWEGVQVAVDPSIAAASTSLVVVALLALVLAAGLPQRRR